MTTRFIHTPLMTDDVAGLLGVQLQKQNSDFAHLEDSVHCVLRISTDPSIHGRLMFIESACANEVGQVVLLRSFREKRQKKAISICNRMSSRTRML